MIKEKSAVFRPSICVRKRRERRKRLTHEERMGSEPEVIHLVGLVHATNDSNEVARGPEARRKSRSGRTGACRTGSEEKQDRIWIDRERKENRSQKVSLSNCIRHVFKHRFKNPSQQGEERTVEHDGPLFGIHGAAFRCWDLAQPNFEALQHSIHPFLAWSALETERVYAFDAARVDTVQAALDLRLDATDGDDVANDLFRRGRSTRKERCGCDEGIVEEGRVLIHQVGDRDRNHAVS